MELKIAEVIVGEMQKQTNDRNESRSSEMTQLQKQEKVVFWGFMIAAGITMIIIVTGIILIFNERLAAGLVAEAAGIVPGAGTVILKHVSTQARKKMDDVSDSRERDLNLLRAIQMIMEIPDIHKRTDAIISLATKLADRAAK